MTWLIFNEIYDFDEIRSVAPDIRFLLTPVVFIILHLLWLDRLTANMFANDCQSPL